MTHCHGVVVGSHSGHDTQDVSRGTLATMGLLATARHAAHALCSSTPPEPSRQWVERVASSSRSHPGQGGDGACVSRETASSEEQPSFQHALNGAWKVTCPGRTVPSRQGQRGTDPVHRSRRTKGGTHEYVSRETLSQLTLHAIELSPDGTRPPHIGEIDGRRLAERSPAEVGLRRRTVCHEKHA